VSNYIETDYVLWSQRHFTMLGLGGTWAVPRSGLIFQKTSLNPPTLTLIERMPHTSEMPMSATELAYYQESDINLIKTHFNEAGIAVVKKEDG